MKYNFWIEYDSKPSHFVWSANVITIHNEFVFFNIDRVSSAVSLLSSKTLWSACLFLLVTFSMVGRFAWSSTTFMAGTCMWVWNNLLVVYVVFVDILGHYCMVIRPDYSLCSGVSLGIIDSWETDINARYSPSPAEEKKDNQITRNNTNYGHLFR